MALEKATLINTITQERIPVLFNPEECSLSRENNFSEIVVPGLRSPLLQFANGALQKLEMELLVDTLEAHVEGSRIINRAGDDVRDLTQKIISLLDIEASTHAPPPVLFTWGSIHFTAVLTQANQTFIMFRENLPVRARVQISLSEFTNAELEAKQTKRETADYTKTRIFNIGDTLPQIAEREYASAKLWPVIAAANGLLDPRRVDEGKELRLPRLPYTDPETGRTYR
jgi:hypothetical protein